jgi:hypothetical protein
MRLMLLFGIPSFFFFGLFLLLVHRSKYSSLRLNQVFASTAARVSLGLTRSLDSVTSDELKSFKRKFVEHPCHSYTPRLIGFTSVLINFVWIAAMFIMLPGKLATSVTIAIVYCFSTCYMYVAWRVQAWSLTPTFYYLFSISQGALYAGPFL